MNNSANSNMYYHTIDRAWGLYACHLEGNRNGFICVISNASLSDAARSALEASMEKLGYGSRACTFISLADASSDAVAPLSAQTLLELIELLDPAILVAADAESARALSEAFHTRLPLFDLSHIAGRATVAFASFTGMLDSMPNKQKAWAILKRLAR